MSDTWKILNRLTEASEKDRLLSYITRKYGEHEADEIKPYLDKVWNPQQLPQLAQAMTMRYADPEIGSIVRKAIDKMVPKGKEKEAEPSRQDLIKGLASGERISPADAEKQRQATAATAASRPDRAGTKANIPPAHGSTLQPGEKPTHDVGTAGQSPGSAPGHTRPVQKQVSQVGGGEETVAQRIATLQRGLDADPRNPQADKMRAAIEALKGMDPNEMLPGMKPVAGAGQELPGLRDTLAQLRQRMARLPTMIQQTAQRAVALKQSNPEKSQQLARQANQMRSELTSLPKQLRDIEGKEKRIAQTGKSGIADAQRQVDYLTQTYGAKRGDAEAKKLGVPTTHERTTTKTDADGNDQSTVAIWSPEKVARWKDRGIEGGAQPNRAEELPPVEPREKSAQHKPMMKAPKGIDPAGLKKLADLRRQYSQLKKSGAGEDELSLAKDEINQILSSGGELVDTVIPGAFDGQRWKPAGMSKKVATARPDKATGKTVHGSKFTDPAKMGQELIWDEASQDWLLPSERAAKRGERKASEPPPG